MKYIIIIYYKIIIFIKLNLNLKSIITSKKFLTLTVHLRQNLSCNVYCYFIVICCNFLKNRATNLNFYPKRIIY